MSVSRQSRRLLAKANASFPATLVRIPPEEWPEYPPNLAEVWRSRHFLAQVYVEHHGIQRLSVSRTALKGNAWGDLITWDELMQLKRECGRADQDALEVYPADRDIVNVANMRHLWIMPTPVDFAWRKD